jgi:hypothetical protein
MQTLTNTTNEHINNYSNIDSTSVPIKKYFYCEDADIKPYFHDSLIYTRKIELINNYFPKEEATNIKPYLFDLNILNNNLQFPELLIEIIVKQVNKSINFSEIPINYAMSLLGMTVYNFIYMSIKDNHQKDNNVEQDNNQLTRIVFGGAMLTLIYTGINIMYEKFNAVYTYGYATKTTKTDDSCKFLLNVTDNENFNIKYPFQHIDIVKLIYIIKEELDYKDNETTELYKIICLSIMELWIEDNLLIEDNTDAITKLTQKIITLIIKNTWVRNYLLLKKDTDIPFTRAVSYINNENNQIKRETLQNNTTTEQQQNILTSLETGFYTVLGSNLLLYIKKSFLGAVTYKIYNPMLQLEVSTKSKDAVNELLNSASNENVFKKIMKY